MMELMPCASWATVCQVESELEEELRQEEKRLLRLKQVFAANRAEFHEALSAILGIAVAIYNSGQQRVMMQYDLGAAFIGGLAYALPVVSMCSFYVQYNMSEEIEMKKFRSPFLRSIVMHTLTQTIFDHLAAEDEDEDEDLLT